MATDTVGTSDANDLIRGELDRRAAVLREVYVQVLRQVSVNATREAHLVQAGAVPSGVHVRALDAAAGRLRRLTKKLDQVRRKYEVLDAVSTSRGRVAQ